MSKLRAAAGLCLLASALMGGGGGCQDLFPLPDFERMIDQRRGKPYAASSYFPHGQLMQDAPEGAVPTHAALESDPRANQAVLEEAGARELARIPVPLDTALMQRGRNRFEIYCAACHGLDGSGESAVAPHMVMRAPPSLVAPQVTGLRVARLYQVISEGYGLMPAYAYELSPRDRWAVVAYLKALQRSQGSSFAALPGWVRAEASKVLR